MPVVPDWAFAQSRVQVDGDLNCRTYYGLSPSQCGKARSLDTSSGRCGYRRIEETSEP